MKIVIALSILAVVLIAGCVQDNPITEIAIPGHPIYSFSNDVRESIKIGAPDSNTTQLVLLSGRNITIVFNGSSEKDNAVFQVTAFNIVARMQQYYIWEGHVLSVDTYYFMGDKWYNRTAGEIEKPALLDTVIWLKGPETGATDNSVTVNGNIITVQGITAEQVTLAGDKLSLIMLGVDRV